MLRRSAVLTLLCLAVLSCGHGKQAGQCEHNFDCAAGQGCVSGKCQVLACGGCQADEACGNDGKCVLAQGASCADHSCPAAYPCNAGGACAKPCTLNQNCDTGSFCNSALKSCTECITNAECVGKEGKGVCDTDPTAGTLAASGHGACVACNVNFDCVKALGTGHFCDAHACKVGCKTTNDCNAGLGETCDTTTNPGKCIQCKTASDCAAQGPSASACDDTGHCVQCFGADQASANTYCGSGTRECNLATKTCVQCLPANNPNGADCGYASGGTMDPHDAQTCNPATLSCTNGCAVDAQCGCPRTASGGTESACPRYPDQEHCDASRTTMAGVTGATVGACVQCTDNTHCEYKVHGTTQYSGAYATMNGSRCINDTCIEGCDSDNDCWPDHATTNGKICHLGPDDNNHKCVQCKCDVLSPDGTYCELKADNTRACNNTAGGAPQVCDSATLSCRRKRQGELCDFNTDCGAPAPGSGCASIGTAGGVTGTGFCVLFKNSQPGVAAQYCSASHGAPGRCGDFCDGSCSCAPQSACATATSVNGAYTACVPNSCNNP